MDEYSGDITQAPINTKFNRIASLLEQAFKKAPLLKDLSTGTATATRDKVFNALRLVHNDVAEFRVPNTSRPRKTRPLPATVFCLKQKIKKTLKP